MSASSSKATSREEVKGFSQKEYQNFLKLGGSLASTRSNLNLEAYKPKEKTKTISTERTYKKSVFGTKKGGTSVSESGFLEEMAGGVTQESIDQMTTNFLNRQKTIQQRKAQPGRAGVFLGGL